MTEKDYKRQQTRAIKLFTKLKEDFFADLRNAVCGHILRVCEEGAVQRIKIDEVVRSDPK